MAFTAAILSLTPLLSSSCDLVGLIQYHSHISTFSCCQVFMAFNTTPLIIGGVLRLIKRLSLPPDCNYLQDLYRLTYTDCL